MDPAQPGQRFGAPADAPPQQEPEVAEAPRDQPEAGHAEERVEDLGVDFDPDAARRVECVAGRCAHCGCGVAEEQEQHAAPADDVEHVECEEEALRKGVLARAYMGGGGTGCTHHGRDEPRPESVQPALSHGPPVRPRIGVSIRGVCGRSGLLVDRRVLGAGSGRSAASAVRGAARPAAAVETAERVAAQIFQTGRGGEGIAGRGAEAIVRVGVANGLCEAGGAGAARGVRWCGHGIRVYVYW